MSTITYPHHETQKVTLSILLALSFCHGLNDLIQALLPAIYPLIKTSFNLNFTQIGLITLTFQVTASLLQPWVGYFTDKHPQPYSLVIGMGFTLCGLLLLSVAPVYGVVLLAAALVGTGSSVFHPESSRMARAASGGRHGFAQSLFQVGGNFGSACGPLVAAFIVVPNGQQSIAWFALAALLAMVLLSRIGRWYKKAHLENPRAKKEGRVATHALSRRKVQQSMIILLLLAFSKFIYLSSLGNYYVFYLMDTFHIPVKEAQLRVFLFMSANVCGTFIGGPIGDRVGRKYVIWFSILGVLPFTLMLPYADLFWTSVLTVFIGLILASAFSSLLVYAQELVPGRVGMVSGLFFGFAFGVAGLGAALLGVLVDHTSLAFVFRVCSFLPAIGILAIFLPSMPKHPITTP